MTGKINWNEQASDANVQVVDGEQTFYARVPANWTEKQVADAFMRGYEVLPEVAEEYGSEKAVLDETRAQLSVRLLKAKPERFFVVPAPGHYGDQAKVYSSHRTIAAARKAAGKSEVVRVGNKAKGDTWLRVYEETYPVAR